jgi:hypothetical protein
VGYDNLGAALGARAARGGRYVPGPDAPDPPTAETVDVELALHLLQLRHRLPGKRTGNGSHAPKRASEKELNEAILAQLDVLARRLRGKMKVLRDGPSPGSSPGSVPPQDERHFGNE